MRLLVKNQKENEPKEPVMPDEEEAKLPFVMKKYETELKQYSKIFVIVKGQCTLNMKNKVESLQDYDSIEANDDVIKLLNGLKELTLKNAPCAIWMLDDMPDSEEGPHNETAGQPVIS
jgi:hypothetical protein